MKVINDMDTYKKGSNNLDILGIYNHLISFIQSPNLHIVSIIYPDNNIFSTYKRTTLYNIGHLILSVFAKSMLLFSIVVVYLN